MGNKNNKFKKKVSKPIKKIENLSSFVKFEKQNILEKIQSKFIFDTIFQFFSESFINYKLELVKYSKLLQKKFNIDLNDYTYLFINSKIDITKYSCLDFNKSTFDKNYLYKEAESKLKSLNFSINELVDITKKYNEKYSKNEKINKFDIISSYTSIILKYDIYCPFIDLYNNYFYHIPLNYIEIYNLKNDYISFFKRNTKYNNLLYITFDKDEQIEILKDLKINISKVKILYFKYFYNAYKKVNISNKFFSELFLLINMKNNLETLSLYSVDIKIDSNIFDSLNNLKSLKHLELNSINIWEPFKITLPNLEIIYLNSCKNIYFDNENSTKNIKYLELENTDMQFSFKYKFDKLEELKIVDSKIDIDFISLKNFKSLKATKLRLIENIFNNSSIEKGNLCIYADFSTKEEEKKLFEMILMNKTLKEIDIQFFEIPNEDLTNINLFNNQIYKVSLAFNNNDFDINHFLKRFLNLKQLRIHYISKFRNYDSYIFLNNDENMCIEDIRITLIYNFDNTVSFSFSKIKNIYLRLESFNKVNFSLFNNNCNDIFYSLENLDIGCKQNITNLEIINNLSKNIEKCKKLTVLKIILLFKEMEKNTFLQIINNILSVKIHDFSFLFQIGDRWSYKLEKDQSIYEKKELKILFPNKVYDYYLYKIQKTEFE